MGGSTKSISTTPKDTQATRDQISGFIRNGGSGQQQYNYNNPGMFMPPGATMPQVANQGNQGGMGQFNGGGGGVQNRPQFAPMATDMGGMTPTPRMLGGGMDTPGSNPVGGGSPLDLMFNIGGVPQPPSGNQGSGLGNIYAQLPNAPPMVQGQYTGNVQAPNAVPNNFGIQQINPNQVPQVTSQYMPSQIAPTDYANIIQMLQHGLNGGGGGGGGGGPMMPQVPGSGDPFSAQYLDYKANQLKPFFDQQRAEAAAQAKEASGNLTGSGFANTLGTAMNRSLGAQQAQLSDYASQQAQGQLAANTQLGVAGINAGAQTGAASISSGNNLLGNMFSTIANNDLQRQSANAGYGLDYAKLGQGGEQFNAQTLFNILSGNQQAGIQGANLANNANQFNAGQQMTANLANQSTSQGVLNNNANMANNYFSQLFGANTGINQQNANNYLQLLNMMGSTGVGPNQVIQKPGFGEFAGQLIGTGLGAFAGGAGAGIGGKLGGMIGSRIGG